MPVTYGSQVLSVILQTAETSNVDSDATSISATFPMLSTIVSNGFTHISTVGGTTSLVGEPPKAPIVSTIVSDGVTSIFTPPKVSNPVIPISNVAAVVVAGNTISMGGPAVSISDAVVGVGSSGVEYA